jgi:hypothetical protein
MDVLDSIDPGVTFRDAIEAAVSSCDVLLAVIGRRWLMLTDSTGRRRLDDPEDLLRFEIAKALSRNVRVIPVLVEGATMPRSEDLPEDLRPLAARQAIDLSENRWNFDVTRLLDTLDRLLKHKLGGRRVPAWLKAVIGAAALIAVAATAWFFLTSGPKSTLSDPKPPPSDGRNKPPAAMVLVPDVRGMTLDAARERIRESGLVVGTLTYSTLSGGIPNTVYAQDTAGGTRVRPESKIGLSVVRQPATPGTLVRLVDNQSYDFSSKTRGKLTGGDFYLNIGNNGAAQFFANNRGQRGLLDLGDIGSPPLDSVRPPATGYNKFGVPVVEGHTYVSLAGEGEEGHHVIFRVTSVTDTFAALAYIYR